MSRGQVKDVSCEQTPHDTCRLPALDFVMLVSLSVLAHAQLCTGLTPDSVLGNHSGRVLGTL